jgi:hypothetical protein
MKKTKRSIMFLLLGALTVPAAMSFAAPVATAPITASTAEPQAKALSQSYAAREATSAAKVESFRGGGAGIYIGGSTAAVVLLVILVLVLL